MEGAELLKQILAAPNVGESAAIVASFSRIRYVEQQMSEEEQAQFLRAIYLSALEARESDSLDALADLLDEWEEKGVAMAGARSRVHDADPIPPWANLSTPISQAKVALVTTGGFYLDGQEPFETDGPERQGDYSFRAIPKSAPRDQIKVAHLHYDLSGPRQDINCVYPLDRFMDLERDGVIGELAETNYSFMGFIQRPDLLMSETAPEVARRLKADGVQAVVLTST
jgi:glycine/betaine/sarcosine/D-proline reductase family selenoprotein B